jgi:hypothetical protein
LDVNIFNMNHGSRKQLQRPHCVLSPARAIGRPGADRELEYGGLLVGGLIKRGVSILGNIIPGFILVFVSMKCLLGTCDHATISHLVCFNICGGRRVVDHR